jgi:hypothetical protein
MVMMMPGTTMQLLVPPIHGLLAAVGQKCCFQEAFLTELVGIVVIV